MTTMEFFQSLDQNKANELFGEVKSPEEAYEIAKENGLTDTFEQFVETSKEVNEAVSSMNEEDINAVVGGVVETTIVAYTVATSGFAVGAASAV